MSAPNLAALSRSYRKKTPGWLQRRRAALLARDEVTVGYTIPAALLEKVIAELARDFRSIRKETVTQDLLCLRKALEWLTDSEKRKRLSCESRLNPEDATYDAVRAFLRENRPRKPSAKSQKNTRVHAWGEYVLTPQEEQELWAYLRTDCTRTRGRPIEAETSSAQAA
jgi:hypothetical protein